MKNAERKNKTLGDYISCGRHEFVAFVKNRNSPQSSNHGTIGNNLGRIVMGVLVCERQSPNDNETKAKFFHKSQPVYDGDSNIFCGDFSYDAEIVSEVPLSLLTSFYSGNWLKAFSREFHEAKQLLKKYGIY